MRLQPRRVGFCLRGASPRALSYPDCMPVRECLVLVCSGNGCNRLPRSPDSALCLRHLLPSDRKQAPSLRANGGWVLGCRVSSDVQVANGIGCCFWVWMSRCSVAGSAGCQWNRMLLLLLYVITPLQYKKGMCENGSTHIDCIPDGLCSVNCNMSIFM